MSEAEDCPNAADHTPCPEGYLAWHEWAARMSKTHLQRRCEGCGLWKVWVPRPVGAREKPYLLRRKRPFPKTVFAMIDRETGTDVGEIHNVTFRSPCVHYEGLLWLDEGDDEGTPGSRLVLTVEGTYRDVVAAQMWEQYVLRRDLPT